MTVATVVRNAVATAKSVTSSLQADITHKAWTGQATSGAKPTYASGVTLPALIDQRPTAFRTALGEVIAVKAVIHILQPIAANGASGREEPIDPRDEITLPNGTVGAPIMGAGGFVDPSTGRPYLYTIGLGGGGSLGMAR